MSVTNKMIRELESAAVDAVGAMNDLGELLEAKGLGKAAQQLRLAAAALDLAESTCARERCLAMSEDELREEFDALGLDWDETTERGHALLQRLLAEHDARREAEKVNDVGKLADDGMAVEAESGRVGLCEANVENLTQAQLDAAELFRCDVCNQVVPWSDGCDDDMPGACSDCWCAAHPEATISDDEGERPRSGFKLPDAPAEPQPRRAEIDPQLLDLPLGHQPGGLGDAGPEPIERYAEMVAAHGERSLHPALARLKQVTEARALLEANGWEEIYPGDWSPAPALGWSIDITLERCSPAILRALAILAEEAQS